MIDTKEKLEQVALVGVETAENTSSFDLSMDELSSLAETAGVRVVSRFEQGRPSFDSKYLVGKGKLEEVKRAVDESDLDTVIFNERLTPRQNINLENYLGVKVIDRMQLILDIFAMRARSHEGMLQVELAQLKYLLPRLTGQGIALSRQAGGIGSRGPGESQLEMNRRHIRTRIENIEKSLKKMEKTRENLRKKRKKSGVYRIGLIGYTNAGKSSLFNALTHKIQYEENELFATLDATTKDFSLQDNFKVTLTDTVGFIQDLPTELISAFKSTLEESSDVDLLIQVIDASNEGHEVHEEVVKKIMEDLDMTGIPLINIYNKADLVDDNFTPTIYPNSLLSIKETTGVEEVKKLILEKLKEIFSSFTICLPYEEGHKLVEIQQTTLIDQLIEGESGYEIHGYIDPKMEWRLENYEHI